MIESQEVWGWGLNKFRPLGGGGGMKNGWTSHVGGGVILFTCLTELLASHSISLKNLLLNSIFLSCIYAI